jgi:predicted lipopolysaccharide heptosyltransferase III
LKTKDLFQKLPVASRILLIRLRSMGDCLLLTSPIRALKEEFPGFRISVLVESRFAGCFERNPDIDEVLSIDKKKDGLQLLGRRYDLVVNLHGGPTSLMYALLARGPHLGFEQYQHGWLYRGLLPSPPPRVHTTEATLAAFQWLGLRRQTPPPLRYEGLSEAAAAHVRAAPPTPYVVIHPAALQDTKRWEPRRFAELARSLQELGLTIVLTCGPGEESLVDEVSRDVPFAHARTGLGISELAELLRGARLYIGNDSGPMHLAAAVGTPVLAIWGSSDSRRWHPWSVEHAVVQNPFECNPCPGYRCLVAPTPLCIESVTVHQALTAARQLLKERS